MPLPVAGATAALPGTVELSPAAGFISTAGLAPLEGESATPAPATRVAELPSLRTEYSSRYLMSDGSVEVVASLDPLNYRDEDGSWLPVDTTVVQVDEESAAAGFVNETNGFVSSFPAEPDSEPLAQVDEGEHRVQITPVDGLGAPVPADPAEVSGSEVVFGDVFGAADLAYTVLPTGVKEDIVLASPGQAQPTYFFELAVGDLVAHELPDGAVGLFEPTSEPRTYASESLVFVLPAPRMADASGAASDEVGLEVDQDGSLVSMVLSPSAGWLNAAERVYPVRIDPTITVAPAADAAQDTMISKAAPSTNYGSEWKANVGLPNGSATPSRALLRFDVAGLVPSGATVSSATLRLRFSQVFKAPTGTLDLAAHRVTSAWTEMAATWDSISGALVGGAADTVSMPALQRDAWHEFDITNMAAGWVDGSLANHGVTIKAVDETASGVQGGPSYEMSENLFGETSTSTSGSPTGIGLNRPQLVLSYGGNGVTQLVPLVVHEQGAELRWQPYVEASPGDEPGDEVDDLVEYQIWRQCVTVGGGSCPTPAGNQFNPVTAEQIGTVDASEPGPVLEFTDTTAAPSTSGGDTVYHYWVVAKLHGDDKSSGDGSATPVLSASNVQPVVMPRSGRVIHVIVATEDTTIAKDADTGTAPNYQTTVLAEPDGNKRLVVGNNHASYGVTRGLLAFDTGPASGLNPEHPVMSARVQLWKTGQSGSGAQFELRRLTRPFTEAGATWIKAGATVDWTTPGGDITGTALQSGVSLDGQPGWVTWPAGGTEATAFAGVVDEWLHPGGQPQADQNNGVLLKAVNEGSAQQRVFFAAAETDDPSFAPRLIVEQLSAASLETYYAPFLPERFIPSNTGAETVVPVTVTNTTKDQTFAADWVLSYRWCEPDSPCSATTNTDPDDGNDTSNGATLTAPLPRALEAGESAVVELPIKAPINSDTGSKRLGYDLAIELRKPDGHWLSEQPPLDPSGGLGIAPLVGEDRLVEANTSSELGLEKWQSYATEPTGAGSALLANLRNGNSVWTWNPIQNASAGPATFVRVTNNGQDSVVTAAGRGWSVQPATLTQLNQPLVGVGGQATAVTLIDGDGTSHTWRNKQTGTEGTKTIWSYDRPGGVPLRLVKQVSDTAGTIPDAQTWVMTRPDGLRFYFNSAGYQTSVVDTRGNRLEFSYSTESSPRLLSVYDTAQAATTLTLTYSGARLATITDRTTSTRAGRQLVFGYNSSGQLTGLTDDPATGSEVATGASSRSFTFGYNNTSDNTGTRLTTITDPRGHQSQMSFGTSGATNGQLISWTDRLGKATTITRAPDPATTRNVIVEVVDANPAPAGNGNETTTYVIDGYGQTLSLRHAEAAANELTQLRWDRDHNVVRLTEPNEALTTWNFDDETGYPLSIRTPQAHKDNTPGITLGYTTLQNVAGKPTVLTSKTTASGAEWGFGYDESWCAGSPVAAGGLLTSVTSPREDATTTYCYGERGVLTKISAEQSRNPGISQVTKFSDFHATGAPRQVRVVVDPNDTSKDLVTGFGYNTLGQTTQMTDPASEVTLVDYDGFARPVTTTAPGAAPTIGGTDLVRTSLTAWDANNNLTSATSPDPAGGSGGVVTATSFNDDDTPSVVTLPDAPDGADRIITYTYDAVGRVLTQTEPKAAETSRTDDYQTVFTYDRIGQLLTQSAHLADGSDPLTKLTTTFAYDKVGNLVSVTNPRDKIVKYGYNLDHQVTSVTDQAGYVTRTRYDVEGRVKQSIDAAGYATAYDYYPDGLTQTVTVPHAAGVQRTTSYLYDLAGNPTTTILPSGNRATTSYDPAGRVTRTERTHTSAAAEAAIVKTWFDYHPNTGRLEAQSDPTKLPSNDPKVDWTRFAYHPSGEIESTTDAWGLTTSYGYNKVGQQTVRQFTSPGGQTTRAMGWVFNSDGSLAARTDRAPENGLVEAAYDNDDDGNMKTIGTWPTASDYTVGRQGKDYATHTGNADPDHRFEWRLDIPENGWYTVEASCVTGAGNATNATYEVTHNNNTDTVAGINQNTCAGGQTWIQLDSGTSGGKFWFAADDATSASGRSSIRLKPGQNTVVADAVRVTKAGDGTQKTRAFTYTYDTNGNMEAMARGEGLTSNPSPTDSLTILYDSLNRAKTVTSDWAGTQVTTGYTYDPNSNVDTVFADHTGNDDAARNKTDLFIDYTYDIRDLVRQVETGTSPTATMKTTKYTYTGRGLRASIKKHNGNEVFYSYFRDGKLKVSNELDGTAQVARHTLTYNADGYRATDVAKVRRGNQATTYLNQTSTYDYNAAGQLTSVTKSGFNGQEGEVGKNETYTYDAAGNTVTSKVDGTESTNTYKHNRLVRSVIDPPGSAPNTTVDYGYDMWGRQVTSRDHSTGNLLSRNTWDGYDRITASFTYQPDGTVQSKKTGVIYDGLDRVLYQETKLGTAAVKKTGFTYLGTSDKVLAEETKTGTGSWDVTATYTYGAGGERLSMTRPQETSADLKESYYSVNPHTDVEAVTDKDGDTTSAYRYTAYGSTEAEGTSGQDANTIAPGATAEPHNTWRYNSKRWEPATRSYDMGFRDYSPGLNQFLSRDMYNGALADVALGTDPWNSNRYAFAGGNPIGGIELDGHRTLEGSAGGGDPNENHPPTRGPDPYKLYTSTDESGNEQHALVQNQKYVDRFGWKASMPEILGTVCQPNVTTYDVYGDPGWTQTECATAGPAHIVRAIKGLGKVKGLNEQQEYAMWAATGKSLYHEWMFDAAARNTPDAPSSSQLRNLSKGFRIVGHSLTTIDLLANAAANLTSEDLSGQEKAWNIFGYSGSTIAGGLLAASFCAETAGVGCALILGTAGTTGGGLGFHKFGAVEPHTTVSVYKPPIGQPQCRPVVTVVGYDSNYVNCQR